MQRQSSFLANGPTLYLVATPIGNLQELSPRAIEVLNSVEYIACEDTRNSKKLLTHFNIHKNLLAYHNFNEDVSTKGLMELLLAGKSIALISDAGYPLVSDPGYNIVKAAINADIPVVAISGPNAALDALVVSGLDSRHYLFYGFLSPKTSAVVKELTSLRELPYTLIFYEAPHRIQKTLKTALTVLGNRQAVIARELTKLHEEIIRGDLLSLSLLDDLKGEIVLLIEGYKADDVIIDYSKIMAHIDADVKTGIKAKDAINEAAKKWNISKNELYNYYHQNKNQ